MGHARGVSPADRARNTAREQLLAGWLRSLWGTLALFSVLLLLAHGVSAAFNQDIYWSAALLAPINVGFALASQRVW